VWDPRISGPPPSSLYLTNKNPLQLKLFGE
jgi:hypothetical protein